MEEPDHGDIFCHINQVSNGEIPHAGDRIECTYEKGTRGLKALGIRIIERKVE